MLRTKRIVQFYKKIIMNIFKKIKMLFSKLTNWFAKLLSKNDEIVKMAAPFGVNICNFIKEYNGNDLVTALKEFILSTGNIYMKTGVGIADKLLSDENMDKVIAALNIADKAATTTNVADKLTLILNYVKSLETNQKSVAWTTLAAMITSDLSDGEIELAGNIFYRKGYLSDEV
jgi:hypothetical protein